MVSFDKTQTIVILESHGVLTESDFESARESINKQCATDNALKGVIFRTKRFPGWTAFNKLLSHLRLIKIYHTQIETVALVTESELFELVEPLTQHFLSAKIKRFDFNALKEAQQWIQNSSLENSLS